jgi:hypothetical protein
MRYILAITFLFISIWGYSQTPPINFATKLNITNVTGSDPYTLSATVNDCLSRFSVSDIAVNDSIYINEGSDLIILVVTGSPSISLGVATFTADDIDNTGITPTGGEAAIVRPSTNYYFSFYVCGIAPELKQLMDARFKQRLDAQLAAGGISDGDKGDVDVTSSGTVWTVDTSAITSLKILDGTVTTGDLAFTPITTASNAGGDLSGPFANLQIVAGAIIPADLSTWPAGTNVSGVFLMQDSSYTLQKVIDLMQDSITGLPTGTIGQTLRHDGSGWVTNSVLQNDGTNVTITGAIRAPDGGIGTPSYSFSSQVNSGFYLPTPGQINIAIAGLRVTEIKSTGYYYNAGSQILPTLSFQGDDNTGLFHPTADNVAVTTGGVERFRVNTTGNVGIGTTSPSERLHVIDNILLTGVIKNSAGSASLPSYTSSADLTSGMWFPGASQVALSTAGIQALTVDASQRVGIGITPAYKLDVSGTSTTPFRLQSSGSTAYMSIHNSSTGTTPISDGLTIGMAGLNANIINVEAGVLNLTTNNNTAVTIDTFGRTEIKREAIFSADGNATGNMHTGGDVYVRYNSWDVADSSGTNTTIHIELDVTADAQDQWDIVECVGMMQGSAFLARYIIKSNTSTQSAASFVTYEGPILTVAAYNSTNTKPTLKLTLNSGTLTDTYFTINVYRGGRTNTSGIDTPTVASVTINTGTNI